MTERSNGARVCIVTPGAIGSNPRVVKEADALAEAGFDVCLISTRTLDRTEPRDQALMRRSLWQLERVDLRSRLNWRLRRLTQLAARQVCLATGIRSLAGFGFSPFTVALNRAAKGKPSHLYIAHYPAALPAAAASARRHGGLYAYDAEDYHLGDWPNSVQYDSERRLVRAIEGLYLPGCAFVTASSPGIADALVATYGIECPRVLLNVFPLSQSPGGPTPQGGAKPGPSLYWFSQTIGLNRGLECAVRALAIAETRPHLYLRGTPANGYSHQLEKLASSVGTADRLHFLAPAAPFEMEGLAAMYDLGLCGEPGHTSNNAMALSNKLFSYLLAGIPPLMSDTPAHRAFATEAGLADLIFPVDNSAALANLIDGLLGSPLRLSKARAQAWQLARERYNWDREKTIVVDTVRAVTKFI
jgi:glycosyltransferase involved in cell wall biosynthesis